MDEKKLILENSIKISNLMDMSQILKSLRWNVEERFVDIDDMKSTRICEYLRLNQSDAR